MRQTLEPAKLWGAFFDAATNLERVDLGDAERGGPHLADVRWGGVNLAVADWEPVVNNLGDDRVARFSEARSFRREAVVQDHRWAVRANRQLALVLREQGLNACGGGAPPPNPVPPGFGRLPPARPGRPPWPRGGPAPPAPRTRRVRPAPRVRAPPRPSPGSPRAPHGPINARRLILLALRQAVAHASLLPEKFCSGRSPEGSLGRPRIFYWSTPFQLRGRPRASGQGAPHPRRRPPASKVWNGMPGRGAEAHTRAHAPTRLTAGPDLARGPPSTHNAPQSRKNGQ